MVKKTNVSSELLDRIQRECQRVTDELQYHAEQNFQFVDALNGALMRREELLHTLYYNLQLMAKSVTTQKRIPDDRKVLKDKLWW